jgi:antitoxin ParD1/3/4
MGQNLGGELSGIREVAASFKHLPTVGNLQSLIVSSWLRSRMPSSTTMNVNLSRDLYQYVRAAVKSGRYTSASEVVRDALREARESALRKVERKIEAALESAGRGELVDGEAVFAEIKRRSSTRRAMKAHK